MSALLEAASSSISFENNELSGLAVSVIEHRLADAQFVLVGEGHYDHEIPRFAGALYRYLHDKHGFHYLAVEQDRLAIEDILRPRVRGNLNAIVAHVRLNPELYEFSSDQDIHFLAGVSRLESGENAIWGLEQALGATRYLTELVSLAPNPSARAEAVALLNLARTDENKAGYGTKFYHDDETVLPRLQALKVKFNVRKDSRAESLLQAMITSAQIFGYDRRAGNGEPRVGILNNTEREAWFKSVFMQRYLSAERQTSLPKVMLKFGGLHMTRGRSAGGAYTLGNFLSEFAISHDKASYSIQVVPLHPSYTFDKLDVWIKALLPRNEPREPTFVDLIALRNFPDLSKLIATVPLNYRTRLLDTIFGYDALVLIPNSRDADMTLTGFEDD